VPATKAEVGPVYDLLLQTRDNSTLPCRNKDGNIVNVSQVAYVTSIDRQAQGQHEETELQHKDRITQLGSPNLIDREFDQWPQVSQGDWSGGMLQPIFSGSTPVSGGASSDPSRFWDGQGVIWPVFDTVPQQPVLGDPVQAEGGAAMVGIIGAGGVVAGSYGWLQSPYASFAYVYEQTTGAKNTVLVIQGAPFAGTATATNPAPLVAGQSIGASIDMFFASDVLFWTYANNTNGVTISYFTGFPTATQTTFATIASASLPTFAGQSQTFGRVTAFGVVGNQAYFAVLYSMATAPGQFTVRLYTVTQGTAVSFIDLPLQVSNVAFFDVTGATGEATGPTSIGFHGSQLVVAWSTMDVGYLIAYDIPTTTFSTLARFPGATTISFISTNGSLFVLASNAINQTFSVNFLDMYLLQGGSLQHIGPISALSGLDRNALITGSLQPETFGPYALFAITYRTPATLVTGDFVAVFAYDVVRGRFFKLNSGLGPYDPGLRVNANGARMGVAPAFLHKYQQDNVASQWAIVLPTLGLSGTQNVQALMIGLARATQLPVIRQGVQIISSQIDFTSAQAKLYRQVVANFSTLPGANISITLDVWLDQDPRELFATPDFTGTVNGLTSPGIRQLKVVVNRIARKLVYRVTVGQPAAHSVPTISNPNPATSPPPFPQPGIVSGDIVAAPTLQEVVVMAAVGWVQTLKLDLAPGAQVNSKNGNVWDRQSVPGRPPIDHVVAYNFLRQLWRQQGGEVTATFPNGDSGNWLIQDIAFDSPKPMAVSFRSDQQTTYQTIATMKLREDL
jgi:hypothetical protein